MLGKAIIYQVLPRLWNPSVKEGALKVGGSLADNGSGHFSNFDKEVLAYLHETLHVGYVWYTGVIRHADGKNDWVKGNAGSPYAIEDYFDVNPYLADNKSKRMDEFKRLVKRTHDAGMKVVLDFIPNHMARCCSDFFGGNDDVSVHWKPENDFYYYPGQELHLPIETSYEEYPAKASGNAFTDSPSDTDWYDTVKLNYCDFHTATWDKMVQVLKFWCSLGVDAFRCDMVEMIPREAIKYIIEKTREEYNHAEFIAEVYDKASYRYYAFEVGFDALYDKCGLYDSLFSIVRSNLTSDAPYSSAERITGDWQFLGNLQPYMLNFIENHDELRVASDFFAGDAKNSFAALYVSLLLNRAPFMLYFGQEAGERGMDAEGFSGINGRTTIFDWWCPASIKHLDAFIHTGKGLNKSEAATLKKYSKLLEYSQKDIIRGGGTYDLQYCNRNPRYFDSTKHFAFLRTFRGKIDLIVANFSKEDADVSVYIPGNAFEWAGVKKDSCTVNVKVKACDGALISLCK